MKNSTNNEIIEQIVTMQMESYFSGQEVRPRVKTKFRLATRNGIGVEPKTRIFSSLTWRKITETEVQITKISGHLKPKDLRGSRGILSSFSGKEFFFLSIYFLRIVAERRSNGIVF